MKRIYYLLVLLTGFSIASAQETPRAPSPPADAATGVADSEMGTMGATLTLGPSTESACLPVANRQALSLSKSIIRIAQAAKEKTFRCT